MESLLWIFEVAATYVEAYFLLVLTGALLREGRTAERKRNEIWIASMETLGVTVFNSIRLVSVIPTLLMLVFMVLMQKWLLHRRTLFCSVCAGIYLVIVTMIDYVVAYFGAYLCHIRLEDLVNDAGYRRLICIVISKSLLIIAVEIVSYLSFDFTNLWHRKNIFIMLAILVYSSIPFVVLLNYRKLYHLGGIFLWILSAFFIAVILLIKYIINSEEKYHQELSLEVQNTKNEILEKSLQDLEKSFAMWKGSVHDYKHAILYMEYLVSENRIDELQQYLQSENEKLEQNCHYYKTGNSMLDVVVNTKYKVMQEKNILFMSDIDVEQTPSITELDLGILLGNLLDNAIEAAESCEVAYVSMAIKYRNSLLEIEITNSYRGETPDFQTTKENKCFHGIGLQSVEKIVERYEGCICTECSREEVTVKTALPC